MRLCPPLPLCLGLRGRGWPGPSRFSQTAPAVPTCPWLSMRPNRPAPHGGAGLAVPRSVLSPARLVVRCLSVGRFETALAVRRQGRVRSLCGAASSPMRGPSPRRGRGECGALFPSPNPSQVPSAFRRGGLKIRGLLSRSGWVGSAILPLFPPFPRFRLCRALSGRAAEAGWVPPETGRVGPGGGRAGVRPPVSWTGLREEEMPGSDFSRPPVWCCGAGC